MPLSSCLYIHVIYHAGWKYIQRKHSHYIASRIIYQTIQNQSIYLCNLTGACFEEFKEIYSSVVCLIDIQITHQEEALIKMVIFFFYQLLTFILRYIYFVISKDRN